ncbi:MAG: hypothetical protein Q8L79_15240 [Methylobacter sp.]|uniref:hypothetical protein n=1 Tax=Methylobacter sp. TaxID=2051955 RepID=UPI002730FC4A|nr:hypothetical protein [Methylobacter sp.]MDP1666464.1 hypothetical protein [Methylobacter sp.]
MGKFLRVIELNATALQHIAEQMPQYLLLHDYNAAIPLKTATMIEIKGADLGFIALTIQDPFAYPLSSCAQQRAF